MLTLLDVALGVREAGGLAGLAAEEAVEVRADLVRATLHIHVSASIASADKEQVRSERTTRTELARSRSIVEVDCQGGRPALQGGVAVKLTAS